MRIVIDAGGTFTDFVLVHGDGAMETFKLRSNPRFPASVILAGLERGAVGMENEAAQAALSLGAPQPVAGEIEPEGQRQSVFC